MLATPFTYTLAAGAAEGGTALNAFDNALLEARIGNVNLVRVSSILPPGAKYLERVEIPPGSLVPAAYCSAESAAPGEVITAVVGVGLSRESFGVIMEHAGPGHLREMEREIEEMIREAFTQRKMDLVEVKIKGAEHRVEKLGSAVAAVVLWY